MIPHQIVRTGDDRVYFFAYQGDGSNILRSYWTTVPGLPGKTSDFAGSTQLADSANLLSVEAAYDGGHIIHVLTNGQDGQIKDRPFDTSTNSYLPVKVLATDGGTVSGYYIGTCGISAMFDLSGRLQLAYWSASNHIIYRAYTYDASRDALTLVDGPTQIDGSGSANHPALAVSPLNGTVTVAWVSQATTPARILVKTKSSSGWGGEEVASSAPVWTSPNSGINIDQGPSLLIGPDGVKHLAYIENWRTSPPYDYGRIHYVSNNGSGWSDQYIGSYSHDPALALNSAGQSYIIGHGYPLNASCTSVDDLCTIQKNANGSWSAPQLFLAHQGSQSFDTSPSVKWSVVGFNRPGTIEFLFADVGAGYDKPIMYYARLAN